MRAWVRIPQQSAIWVLHILMSGTQSAIKTEQEMEQAVFSQRAKGNYCTKLNKRGSKQVTVEIRTNFLPGLWHHGLLENLNFPSQRGLILSTAEEVTFSATVDCNYHVLKSSSYWSFAYTSVLSMLRTGIWICLTFQMQKHALHRSSASIPYISLKGKLFTWVH